MERLELNRYEEGRRNQQVLFRIKPKGKHTPSFLLLERLSPGAFYRLRPSDGWGMPLQKKSPLGTFLVFNVDLEI